MNENGIKRKVGIVGMGAVGSTAAYALLLDGAVSDLALVDIDGDKAQGDALDLNHCMMFTSLTTIQAGDDFSLLKDAQVVVVTAGAAQRPGQSRTDLLQENATIFADIIPRIAAVNDQCILLVVTNPLDVMTYLAWHYAKFDSCKVFGTGTVLDTARLRYLIGQQLKVAPDDVSAYVLGEHGDASFVWWSRASVAGIGLEKFTGYSSSMRDKLEYEVRDAAYQIIEKKGATCYAIASVVAQVVRSILFDQPLVFSVSSIVHNRLGFSDMALSLPTIIRRDGVCEMLDIALDQQEEGKLAAAAKGIAGSIATILG